MSEELKALENIKHYDSRVGLHEDDYKLIEKALKALEIIKKDPTSALLYIELYKSGCGIITNGKVINCSVEGEDEDEDEDECQARHKLLREVLL